MKIRNFSKIIIDPQQERNLAEMQMEKMDLRNQLEYAINNHDHPTFTGLLKQFSVDELNEGRGDGVRPLHLACVANNHEAVNQLLKIDNIDANVQSDEGATPFMIAVLKNSVQCVRLLANNENVDIFQKIDSLQVGREGSEESQKIVSYIRKKRAERIQNGTVPVLYQLIEYIESKDDINFTRILSDMDGEEVNKGDLCGIRPLHVACANNNGGALEKLLNIENIDVNVQSIDHSTPFMYAFSNGSIECLELLLQDLRVNIFLPRAISVVNGSAMDQDKTESLIKDEKIRRKKLGKVSMLQQLIESIKIHDYMETRDILKKMSSDEVNEAEPICKYTPLHVACSTNNPKAVAELLKFENIDTNARDNDTRLFSDSLTPFMLAVKCRSLECIEVLMGDGRVETGSLEDIQEFIRTICYYTQIPEHAMKETEQLVINLFKKIENLRKLKKRKQNKKNHGQGTDSFVESSARTIGDKNVDELLEFIEGANISTKKTKKKKQKIKLPAQTNINHTKLDVEQSEENEENNTVEMQIEDINKDCGNTISYCAPNSNEEISKDTTNENKLLTEELKWNVVGNKAKKKKERKLLEAETSISNPKLPMEQSQEISKNDNPEDMEIQHIPHTTENVCEEMTNLMTKTG